MFRPQPRSHYLSSYLLVRSVCLQCVSSLLAIIDVSCRLGCSRNVIRSTTLCPLWHCLQLFLKVSSFRGTDHATVRTTTYLSFFSSLFVWTRLRSRRRSVKEVIRYTNCSISDIHMETSTRLFLILHIISFASVVENCMLVWQGYDDQKCQNSHP
jgi:hypothetical protein